MHSRSPQDPAKRSTVSCCPKRHALISASATDPYYGIYPSRFSAKLHLAYVALIVHNFLSHTFRDPVKQLGWISVASRHNEPRTRTRSTWQLKPRQIRSSMNHYFVGSHFPEINSIGRATD